MQRHELLEHPCRELLLQALCHLANHSCTNSLEWVACLANLSGFRVLYRHIEWLTWLALLEDNLPSLQSVVLHALSQAKQLAVVQAEEDGDLAQRLKAPHVLDGPQQAVKGLACQGVAHQLTPGCYCCSPTDQHSPHKEFASTGSNTAGAWLDYTSCAVMLPF